MGSIPNLAYSALNAAVGLSATLGGIFNYYIAMFGSRYVGDKRYDQFWGLNRAMLIGTSFSALFVIVQTPGNIETGSLILLKV